MTGDNQTDAPAPANPGPIEESHDVPQLSARKRQVLEIILWVFAPIILVIGASVIALVLGAPWLRASMIFALVAIGVGILQLSRPQRWIPAGAVRSGGLIYGGLGAVLLAISFSAGGAERPARSDDVGRTVGSAPDRPRAPMPVARSVYPWAYSVSPLTVTCEASTALGEGQVIATANDGRVFAVNEAAQSGERPAIATIERRDGDADERRHAVVDFATSGRALCLGPGGLSGQLILSEGEPPPPPPPPPSPWSYNSRTDEMSDARIAQACTASTNSVNLGWPYESQRVTLCLRQHPRWGQDAIIRLERGGQFLCTSYRGCTVRIRFDDGEAAAYSAAEPSDNSSDTLFISNDARFIGNLRRSSRIIIEAEFYQAGAQRMSFDTRQLEWPPRS